MTTKNRSHSPEHYAELRERWKEAGVREKRFKVLEDDILKVDKLMAPFVNRATEAKDKITDAIRAREREKERR